MAHAPFRMAWLMLHRHLLISKHNHISELLMSCSAAIVHASAAVALRHLLDGEPKWPRARHILDASVEPSAPTRVAMACVSSLLEDSCDYATYLRLPDGASGLKSEEIEIPPRNRFRLNLGWLVRDNGS